MSSSCFGMLCILLLRMLWWIAILWGYMNFLIPERSSVGPYGWQWLMSAAAWSRWLPRWILMANDRNCDKQNDVCFRHNFAVLWPEISGQGTVLKYRLHYPSGLTAHKSQGGCHWEGALYMRFTATWLSWTRVYCTLEVCCETKKLGLGEGVLEIPWCANLLSSRNTWTCALLWKRSSVASTILFGNRPTYTYGFTEAPVFNYWKA